MAIPSYENVYAVKAGDPEMLRKRQELGKRLIAAKESGKSLEEAVRGETGVDINNIQKGSFDTELGTGLSEEEIIGGAQRMFAQKTDASKVPQAAPESKGPLTPRLDRLAGLQGTPMGSTSSLGQRRSLESEGGKAMRLARKLERQGFGQAAEKMALAGAELKMNEPSIKTEAYREQESAMRGQAMSQEKEDEKMRRDLLKAQLEAYKNMNLGQQPTIGFGYKPT